MCSVIASVSEDVPNRKAKKSRFFALPRAYYEAVAEPGLNSTDKKVLLAVIWFTHNWRQPTKTVPLKELRRFAGVSERAFYESRKRLVAFGLIQVQEQRPVRCALGATKQGHTEYTMLLKAKPYVKLDEYALIEAFAPRLSGPELVLWVVIMRKERDGGFWFASLTQLQALTGYGRTAIKEARNGLLRHGLIDGCRGLSGPLTVAGYRSISAPSPAASRRWETLSCFDLWNHLREQQIRHTDSYMEQNFSAKEAAFLSNVYMRFSWDFLDAADALTCRLADQGRLYLLKTKLMALANRLNREQERRGTPREAPDEMERDLKAKAA